MSGNGVWLVGHQYVASFGQQWTWISSEGFSALPPLNAADAQLLSRGNWAPMFVSSDGQVVVGHGLVPGLFMMSSLPVHAVRWDGQSGPVLLRDADQRVLGRPQATSEDGRVVFGYGRERATPGQPLYGDPWYWMEGGQQAYLGRALDGDDAALWMQCFPGDATADGNMMVGLCSRNDGSYRYRPFAWTSHTGMISLSVLGDDEGLARFSTIRISSNGRNILLVDALGETSQPPSWRSRVLRLEPRQFPTGR